MARGATLGAYLGPEGILIGGVVGAAAGYITGYLGGIVATNVVDSFGIKQCYHPCSK